MLHRIFAGVVTAILFCLVVAVSRIYSNDSTRAKYLLFSFYNSSDHLSSVFHYRYFCLLEFHARS